MQAELSQPASRGFAARLVLLAPDGSTRVLTSHFHSARDGDVSDDGGRILFAGQAGAGGDWNFETASKLIAHPAQAPARAELVQYKTPLNLAFRPGGKELYVTCERSSTLCVIDTATGRKLAEIPVGGQPTDVTFSPDGLRAYATNRLDDSLSLVDTATRRCRASAVPGCRSTSPGSSRSHPTSWRPWIIT